MCRALLEAPPCATFINDFAFDHQMRIFFSDDSLTIYDGGSSTSPMMGKFCGASIPPSHVSSSNEILIQFQSDEYEDDIGGGFQMEYNPLGKQITSIQNSTECHDLQRVDLV